VASRLVHHLDRTASLYVNGYNHVAQAAYRRIGFEQVGQYATVLF
jgi:predicted GNAT family acetyltransferase